MFPLVATSYYYDKQVSRSVNSKISTSTNKEVATYRNFTNTDEVFAYKLYKPLRSTIMKPTTKSLSLTVATAVV